MDRINSIGQSIEYTMTTVLAQTEEWVDAEYNEVCSTCGNETDVPAQKKIITPIPEKIGQKRLIREIALAYESQCEEWAEKRRREGFTVGSFAHFATGIYNGPTDSKSNCWLVRAERVIPNV